MELPIKANLLSLSRFYTISLDITLSPIIMWRLEGSGIPRVSKTTTDATMEWPNSTLSKTLSSIEWRPDVREDQSKDVMTNHLTKIWLISPAFKQFNSPNNADDPLYRQCGRWSGLRRSHPRRGRKLQWRGLRPRRESWPRLEAGSRHTRFPPKTNPKKSRGNIHCRPQSPEWLKGNFEIFTCNFEMQFSHAILQNGYQKRPIFLMPNLHWEGFHRSPLFVGWLKRVSASGTSLGAPTNCRTTSSEMGGDTTGSAAGAMITRWFSK